MNRSQSLKRYWNTVRAIRNAHPKLSNIEARHAAKDLKERLGYSPSRVDVRKHPVITGRAVRAIKQRKKQKINSKKIIEQVIQQLEETADEVRQSITGSHFNEQLMEVKLSIDGDKLRTGKKSITAHTDRKGIVSKWRTRWIEKPRGKYRKR